MGRRNLFSVKMVKGRQSILPASFPKGASKKNESRSPEAYRRFVSLTECPNQKSWQNDQTPTCSTTPVGSALGWRLPVWTVPLPAWLTHAIILSGVNEGCLWTPWNKQEYQVLSRAPLPKGGGGAVAITAISLFLYENIKIKLIILMLLCSILHTPVFGCYFYGLLQSPHTFTCLNFNITRMLQILEKLETNSFCFSQMITLSQLYRSYSQKQTVYWPGPLEAF